MLMTDELTGGGGGQGFSAFGGAIEAGRIGTLGMLAGVVSHHQEQNESGSSWSTNILVRRQQSSRRKKNGHRHTKMTN